MAAVYTTTTHRPGRRPGTGRAARRPGRPSCQRSQTRPTRCQAGRQSMVQRARTTTTVAPARPLGLSPSPRGRRASDAERLRHVGRRRATVAARGARCPCGRQGSQGRRRGREWQQRGNAAIGIRLHGLAPPAKPAASAAPAAPPPAAPSAPKPAAAPGGRGGSDTRDCGGGGGAGEAGGAGGQRR